MTLFPPGKGGGEGVAYGYKGKEVLIHTITEGNSMPMANRTTSKKISTERSFVGNANVLCLMLFLP